MTKVTICTPVWKRREMRLRYLDHMKAHIPYAEKEGIELTVSIVGSEGKFTRRSALERGFAYVHAANSPLGNKWNESIRNATLLYEPDYIMITGSDTFMLPSIWKEYAKRIDQKKRYIGTTDLYMWDWRDNRAVYWAGYQGKRQGEPIGPGRMIHKTLIPSSGDVYTPSLDKNLDRSFTQRILTTGEVCNTFMSKEHLLVSCKGDENLTEISGFEQDELIKVSHHLFDTVMAL